MWLLWICMLFYAGRAMISVDRVDCSHLDFSIHTVLANFTYPMIFFNTSVVQSWGALQWTTETLRSHIPVFRSVYTLEKQTLFGPVWDEEKPLAKLASVRKKNAHTFKNLSSTDFFAGNHTPFSHYYVAPIESLDDLLDDILPAHALLVDVTQSQVNVWMGHPGVTALLHFDSYHNLNVQVLGTKQFVLYPPSAWEEIRPYPFLHPSHAQSQLDGNLSNIRAPAYEAILGPGDVLYIPPLWWHQVTAKTLSVSVNFWSESDQARVMGEALEMVIAAAQRQALHPAKLLGAAQSLIEEFLSLLFSDPTDFIERVVVARYSALLATGELVRAVDCPKRSSYSWRSLSRELAALFTTRLVSNANREVWAADLLENLAFWGLGTRPNKVGAFLGTCLFKAAPPRNDL